MGGFEDLVSKPWASVDRRVRSPGWAVDEKIDERSVACDEEAHEIVEGRDGGVCACCRYTNVPMSPPWIASAYRVVLDGAAHPYGLS